MGKTTIEWTDATWNPTVGCTRVSPGCKNCYAFELHDRRHRAHQAGKNLPAQYAQPFAKIQLMHDRLDAPLHWRSPRLVFVNSMSDLFHEDIPYDFTLAVFDVMRRCTWAGGRNCGSIEGPGHTFQILTKRADRLRSFMTRLRWNGERLILAEPGSPFPPGTLHSLLQQIWLGVSVENRDHGLPRIEHLRATPAAVRFLSIEPLLDNLGTVNLAGIHWVIVGGESGPYARPMDASWVRSIRDQCLRAGVPFFFKQWGEWLPAGQDGAKREFLNCSDHAERIGKKAAGRLFDGRLYNDFPRSFNGV